MLLLLKPVLYLSACQQCLGQAHDLWPLTVKLTLLPLGCCAKCQERPLIPSRRLVDRWAADYLSRPCIPASAQICCGLFLRRQDHLLIQPESCRPTATREELLQRSSERVKIQTVKSCRRDGKVLRGGENWYCEGNRVCVLPLSFYSPGVFRTDWPKRGIAPWPYLSRNTRGQLSPSCQKLAQWTRVW